MVRRSLHNRLPRGQRARDDGFSIERRRRMHGNLRLVSPALERGLVPGRFRGIGAVTGSLLPAGRAMSGPGESLATQPQHPAFRRRAARDDLRRRAIDARRRHSDYRPRPGQPGAHRWHIGTGDGIIRRSGNREEAHGPRRMAGGSSTRRRVLPGRRLRGRAVALRAVGARGRPVCASIGCAG